MLRNKRPSLSVFRACRILLMGAYLALPFLLQVVLGRLPLLVLVEGVHLLVLFVWNPNGRKEKGVVLEE